MTAPAQNDFATWMAGIQERTENALDQFLPSADIVPHKLHEAMRYATLGGGKRVRPLLTHATGSLFAASPEALDRAACAVEMIHAYSLIHDDLPCMDDDVLRRGKPTCHVQFDEATAMLAGDALQAQGFVVLGEPELIPDTSRQVRMLQLLAKAAGSRGMAGGQAVDLASVGKKLALEDLEFMHIRKTGALIRAAVLLGAHCGTADEEALASLSRYANRVGLLFQVVDDLLDIEADTATLGKTAGKDALHDKPTYVSIVGLARSRELAREMSDEAHAVLAPFGERAQRLHQLTDFIIARTY